MMESRKDGILNNEAAADTPSAERPGFAVDLPSGTRGEAIRRFAPLEPSGVGEEGGEIDCVLGSRGGGELGGSAGDFPFEPFKAEGFVEDRRLLGRVTGGEADLEVGGEAKPLPRGDTGDRALGGATGEADRLPTAVAEGDTSRRGRAAFEAAEAPDVAACRKVGGAVARTFALALLAAIAAATDDFFGAGVATAAAGAEAPGFGLTFCSSFFAGPSRVLMINSAFAGQISWNIQKTIRACTRTPGF